MFCKLSYLVLINCFFCMNFFAANEFEKPGNHNQEEGKSDYSCYEDARSKISGENDNNEISCEFYSCNSKSFDKIPQNYKKEEENIIKDSNNNNERIINANMEGMSVFNNADNNGNKEVNVYNAAPTCKMDGQNNNDDTNVQYTKANHNSIPVQYNNNNFFPINARNRTIEIENDGTTTEGLDSTPNIKFIQIPKKGGLKNSKLGLQKVCSCKCMSRN